MKRFVSILTIAFLLAGIGAGINVQAKRSTIGRTVTKAKNKNSNKRAKQERVAVTSHTTTGISFMRDGRGNTPSGYGFMTDIDPYMVEKIAGYIDGNDWLEIDGVINTYRLRDSIYFTEALKLINSSNLFITDRKKPSRPVNGTTKLIIRTVDEDIELVESPEYTNFSGDLNGLVNQLVELTGGEAEFGGPVVPYPDPESYPYDDIYDPENNEFVNPTY